MKNLIKIIFILASFIILSASALAADAVISPANQATDDQDLVCRYGTLNAPASILNEYEFKWYRTGSSNVLYESNGAANGQYTEGTLPAGQTSVGDRWYCEVWYLGSKKDTSDPVEIVESVNVQPTSQTSGMPTEELKLRVGDYLIFENESAVCSYGPLKNLPAEAWRADLILAEYEFKWYFNGHSNAQYETSGSADPTHRYTVGTLTPDKFEAGDEIYCEVWFLGNRKQERTKDPIVVEPIPGNDPVVGSVSILPYEPTTEDQLTCVYQVPEGTNPGIFDAYEFKWYDYNNNKQEFNSKPSYSIEGTDVDGNPGAVLPEDIARGDRWKCEVWFIGTVKGSSSALVLNALPVINPATVSISPDPAYTDNDLTCNAPQPTDADTSDVLGVEYAWLVNNNLVQGANTRILSHANFVKHDTVTCRITPYDNYGGRRNYGASAEDSIVISNSAPRITLPDSVLIDDFGASITQDYSAPNYIYDADGDPLTLTFAGNSQIGVSVNGLRVTYTAPNTRANEVVTFTVRDNEGASASDSLTVVVDDNIAPVADFTFSPAEPNTYETIAFTDLSTDADGDTLSYSWDFGDGITSTARNPTHQYTEVGVYDVTLTVNDGIDSDSETKQIRVSARLNVESITCVSSNIQQGDIQTCNVRVTAEGAPAGNAEVNVYFTDGSLFGTCTTNRITGACGVSRTMNALGTYTVYATAEKEMYVPDLDNQPQFTFTVGQVGPEVRNLVVYNNPNFSIEDYDFFRGQDMYVKFQVVDTNDNNRIMNDAITQVTLTSPQAGGIVNLTVEKDLNDGWYYYSLRPIPPTHEFIGESQVFTFSFRFADNTVGQEVVNITIRNNLPVIGSVPAISVERGASVDFNLSGYKSDVEDSGSGLVWEVTSLNENIFTVSVAGDILTVTGVNEGTANLQLVLSDLDLDNATKTVLVTVTPGINNVPVADFTYSPAEIKVLRPVQFTDLSTDADGNNDIVAWSWNFGDGSVSTAQNPSHTYQATGNYSVTLTVTDSHGASDSVTRVIEVKGGISIVSIDCFSPVITHGTQSCSVYVDVDGEKEGDVDVKLYYSDDTFIQSCKTDALSSGCNIVFEAGEPGNYSVYAIAEKPGLEADNDKMPSETFEVWAHRYDIKNLKTYSNNAFSIEEDEFFRGENLYVKFQVTDRNNADAVVNDIVTAASLVSPPGGRANLAEYQNLGNGWYYYALQPIPLTHDFKGESQVFTFVFNFEDKSIGQEEVNITIKNNHPVITGQRDIKVPITASEAILTVSDYVSATDLEDSSNLRWSTSGADNSSVAAVSIVADGTKIKIVPKALGITKVELVVEDLDGDSAKTVINVEIVPAPGKEEFEFGDEEHIKLERIMMPTKDRVQAGDTAVFSLNLKNDGELDSEGVRITAYIQDIPYARVKIGPFDLAEGDEVTKQIKIDVPKDTKPGTYNVRIVVTSFDEVRRVENRMLRVTE